MYKHKLTDKEKRGAVYFLIIVVLCFLTLYGYKCVSTKVCGISFVETLVRPSVSITLPNGTIKAEVADTKESREEGLSGRSGLSDKTGMLFVFGLEGAYGFWMKDMLFPIDMVWINDKGVVVNVVENAKPEDYPATYVNHVPASYVLEIGSGKAGEYGIYLGTKVDISK